MRNVTFEEWADLLTELSAKLQDLYRLVRIDTAGEPVQELWFTTEVCSGVLDLRQQQPHLKISGGTALAGKLSDVSVGLEDYSTVIAAMRRAGAMLGSIKVWLEGECPCDRCGARGTSQGLPCKFCNGEGRR